MFKGYLVRSNLREMRILGDQSGRKWLFPDHYSLLWKEFLLEEVFLSSNPFADWRSQVHRQPDDRFISLDSDIFPATPYFKGDALTLLPSVEYKARLAAKGKLFIPLL